MINHKPVLIKQVIEVLNPQPNENFIDCTLGFGGHSLEILKRTSPKGQLLGIDQDIEAIEEAQKRLKEFEGRASFENKNFRELGLIIRKWPVEKVDGILFDLGASTYQLKSAERGFSFKGSNSPLDMRMNKNQSLTAAEIVNKYSEKEIAKILFELGEERFSRQIARKIVEKRKNPIKTTSELVNIIKEATPPVYRNNLKIHFASKSFMALRIAVNNELENLRNGLKQALQILSPGGRIAVISFHSLEDRIVKNFLRDTPELEVLTKKPIEALQEEIKENPNSRSAKLRAARKI